MKNTPSYTLADLPPALDHSCAVSLLIYEWFHRRFPSWEPDLNPKHLRNSQSLVSAPLPEPPHSPEGMVHFKSILDPLWSAADLSNLSKDFSWILLVLSPFERFYELDPLLDGLSLDSPRLVIWRPDRPTAEESARLRVTSLVPPVLRSEEELGNRSSRLPDNDIHPILESLYLARGSLLVQGVRHSIRQELGDLGAPRYISACLRCVAATLSQPSGIPVKESERLALHWAALVCGDESLCALSTYAGESQVLAWAVKHLEFQSGVLSAGWQPLPEPFLTTRFRDEAKWFDSASEQVSYLFRRLRRGELTFVTAMLQVSKTFGGEEARLLRWKTLVEGLPNFMRWMPKLETSRIYLSGACPSPFKELEEQKKALLASCIEPHLFLDGCKREYFDQNFEEFRRGYIRFYESAHEDSVHIVANQEKMRAKVDSTALRNLEMLSDLDCADKSFLNRVRAIGKFVQANQCDLPVKDILERQPRCYCNFNPAGNRLLAKSVDQMNEEIRRGIAYFRSLLRRGRMQIIQELKAQQIDDGHARQIGALFSNGPMIPLKPRAIEIVNAVIRKHPEVFRLSDSRHVLKMQHSNQLPPSLRAV